MYGWLLESVEHFIVKECGEEVWETILRDAGARNTVFNATQQYPDGLMLRLANCLVRLVTKDPNSPVHSIPGSPALKKPSLKSKESWRSTSVNTDNRTQSVKCPFTATIALTAATQKEIDEYNSMGELRGKTTSTERFNQQPEVICPIIRNNCIFASKNDKDIDNKTIVNKTDKHIERNAKSSDRNSVQSPDSSTSPISLNSYNSKDLKEIENKNPTIIKKKASNSRKNSCTDVYRRRGSGISARVRLNSISGDKLSEMRQKFGTLEKVMHFFGRCFVKFFSNHGYDDMIRATGRYFCTFLQSVDSIHQRMRFTFPHMRSPTMQLTRAHQHGAELVYRSARNGLTHYLTGQLYEIAEDIFSLKLKVSVVRESTEGAYNVAILRLEFDNSDYVQSLTMRKCLPCPLPSVSAALLLQLFPFGVILDRDMRVVLAGDKLLAAWGGPLKRINNFPVADILRLRKPKMAFTWDKVVCKQTMLFELELVRWRPKTVADGRRGSQTARVILLKGPIKLLEEIDSLVFLCSPIFNDLEELSQAGLYLADLNGHGLSKEMLLHGWQHLSRLELMFEKAETRSLSLAKSCKLLDQWIKRGDRLLYSMIPRAIADHLRSGKDPITACQAIDCVTVMFCGLQLSGAGTRADVMQTVAYINDVYSKIDRLLDSHRVFKVETVGMVYMVVAGAPDRELAHASSAASAALAVSMEVPKLTVGVHSGPCVAGVLGRILPRYCLVGDTVNTASRMQTSSEPGRIQISAATAALLADGKYRLRRRGQIKVKGKGMMETFWLEGENEDEQHDAMQLFSALCGDN